MARPTKLSEHLQGELCAYLKEGVPVSTACELVGITTETFYAWSRQGSREEGTPLAAFSDAVRRARSQGELELLRTAKNGDDRGESNGPAKCAQWMLERTRGKKYSPRINVKVEEELEVLLDVVERVCASKDCHCYEEILAAVTARDSGEETEGDPAEQGGSVH